MKLLTALLLLCALAARAQEKSGSGLPPLLLREGAIIRGPVDKKEIALEFSADEFTESGPVILDELDRHHIKASFFLTGRCLFRADNRALVERIVKGGHYLGPHSDAHPLLCSWGERKTLVTKEFFQSDLERNLKAIEGFGIKRSAVGFFLPPYEWSNREIAGWTRERGLRLVNFTPGTRANADYTEEGAANYASSQAILDSILRAEATDKHGADGWLLLMHLGAGPRRADKMASRLGEVIETLQKKGYRFVRIDAMLDPF